MNNSNNIDITKIGIDLIEYATKLVNYFIENIYSISMVVSFILLGLVLNETVFKSEEKKSSGKKIQTVIIESLDSFNNESSLEERMKTSFCESNLGNPEKLEQSCKTMIKPSCTSTSCCVWAKMNKKEECVSGNKDGPIFVKEPLDYYYFENKCVGNCPKPKPI
ncbi:MAG: hypothetical protein FJX80_03225 [Bacteroidetes bacterium]|jgi:hypothetical protein|nr:hypothetical protein [Bacteroidota bacterium]